MVEVTLESITPEMAEEWLATSNTHNRNIRDTAVIQYARDMENGNWLMTGAPIAFATDGELLDGQHRLMAIARSGETVEMFVARNLENNAQKVMDTNLRRGVGDMLKLDGYHNPMNLGAAIRLAMTYETDVPGTRRRPTRIAPTHLEVNEFLKANPDIVDATQSALRYRHLIDCPVSALSVSWWEMFKLNEETCESFFDSIANNTTNGVGDPRNTLIQRFASARRQSETIPQNAYLSMMFRAWNFWVKGEELYRMQVSNSRDGGLIAIPSLVKPQ
jgi:hypothetical protein